jgi:RNA polymerase sigma-70 factor, ECF subfamily
MDRDEFDEFYRATTDRMVRYAYAMSGDRAAAQDLAQEAYMRAWQHWRRLHAYDHPEAWVRLVVTRLCADRRRRFGVRSRALRAARPPDPVPPPSEETVLLTAALRRLPVEQRRVLVLHYLMDIAVADIARETGTSLGTVKSRLSRGRAALAEILAVAEKEQTNAC